MKDDKLQEPEVIKPEWEPKDGECRHGKRCPDFPLCQECPFEEEEK